MVTVLDGFWNGEPCKFYAIRYLIQEVLNSPYHWQNKYIGTYRQIIRVEYGEQFFYIDNEHGSGYYKLTEGEGSPQYPHNSIDLQEDDSLEFSYCTIVNTELNLVAINAEQEEHDSWLKEKSPEQYQRMMRIRELLKESGKELRTFIKPNNKLSLDLVAYKYIMSALTEEQKQQAAILSKNIYMRMPFNEHCVPLFSITFYEALPYMGPFTKATSYWQIAVKAASFNLPIDKIYLHGGEMKTKEAKHGTFYEYEYHCFAEVVK